MSASDPEKIGSLSFVDDRIAVSVSEASRLSGLGRTLLYEEMRKHRLRHIRRGRRRLIRLDDLRAYLAAESDC